MKNSPQKVTVVGLGAIGGLLAAALARAGWSVAAL
ncbi:2-dehydropantoate 2-reductase, partial [Burkholderia sp. Cy-647]|nr:2-dehydropantoate 2-reductase [Burkholderia sp. Cy-647]